MSSVLTRILDSSMYSPHGLCLLWEPELVWLHVVSDALTAVAYLSIPAVILIVWLKRPDFKYRWVAWLFVAFIVSCGITHALSIYTLWVPIYGVEGLVKAITAAASVFTALALWSSIPDLLIMPTLAQMKSTRIALKNETHKARNAEQLLQRFRDTEATAEQIRQAQKMEAVGQLTGGIAHDFNNLLTVITGSVDELSASLRDRPRLAGLVEMIDQAASRGATLTAQLLAFARKQPLNPSAVDINAMTERMVRMLRRTLGQNIEIETVLTDTIPPALVDQNQLETALLNLALNARDAMPNGGRITIETSVVELLEARTDRYPDLLPGWYMMISLIDSGRGISAEDLAKVFEPFFTTKEVGKGTGLGLSMVYGFAKQSKGHVVIDSGLGRGTKVTLYLPATAPPSKAISGPTEAPSAVLVIEDDPLVDATIAGLIRRLGFRALSSSGPSDAVNQLAQPKRIDALLIGTVRGAISRHQLLEEASRLKPALKVLLLGATDREQTNVENVIAVETPWTFAGLSVATVAALTERSRILEAVAGASAEMK